MVDYEWLIAQGLIDSEAKELADSAYNLPDYERITYLYKFLAQRKSYIADMRRRNYSDKEISARIQKNIYERRKYNTVWDLIRRYRQKSIMLGEYEYAGRKKKSGKIDREALARQKRKISLHKTGDAELDRINDNMLRALQRRDTAEWQRLQNERNEKYGY